MHFIRAFLSSAVGLLLCVGLAAPPGLVAPPRAFAQDVLHEVQAGDDLRLIAGYYYGDTRQWERIWQANREIIRNPNRIERGSYLWIPDPKMPAESYAAFVAQARKPAPAAPAPAQAGIQIPKVEGQAGTPGEVAPATPAPPPTKAPLPPQAAKAPPVPAPPPAKTAPPAGPQKPPEPAKAAAPPAKADVAKAPQPAAPAAAAPAKAAAPPGTPAPPAPAAQPAKAPVPPPKKPLPPPPPPPKEWYEELLSPEFLTSVQFLGGMGVVVLGLVGLLIWRRRSAATSEE